MKKALIVLIILVLNSLFLSNCNDAASGCSRNKNNDLSKLGLKGRVSRTKETQYNAIAKFGEVRKADRSESGGVAELFFNEFGNKTKELTDNLGKYETTYKYDEKNVLIESTSISSLGSYTSKYEYSDSGKLAEENQYYSEDGGLFSKEKFKYDEKSNLIEIDSYDGKGDLTMKNLFKYNEKKQIVEELREDSGMKMKFVYKYNVKNNVSEEDYFLEMKILSKESNKNRKFDYSYDKNGNWVNKVIYENGQLKFLVEREIEYY